MNPWFKDISNYAISKELCFFKWSHWWCSPDKKKKGKKSLLYRIKPLLSCFCVLQLIASNLEGRSSPSEVLVCNTSPDKPGPPSRPCIKGSIRPYSFSVKWGMAVCAAKMFSWSCCICWIGFLLWGKLEISFMFGGKCNRFCIWARSFVFK